MTQTSSHHSIGFHFSSDLSYLTLKGAGPIYTIHIKSNFINFNFLIIFYVRFKERNQRYGPGLLAQVSGREV